MDFIDTHFHLDLWPDPKKLIDDIEKNRIYTIAVTNTPSVFSYTFELTKSSKYVRPGLGLHPELVFERYGELAQFHELINKTRYIGEIGLDFSVKDKTNHKLQRDVFEAIIEGCSLAKESKVLTIHSRKAEKEVLDTIGPSFPGKVILHWYSGSLKELRRAVDYGFYFSINSAMVRSKAGQRILAEIPLERILTESDGPFIKDRNGVPISPINIINTVKKLSVLLGKDESILRKLIYTNFKSILLD